MTKPDIQHKLLRHITGSPAVKAKLEAEVARNQARRLARLVALRALKLAKAGNIVEATKAQAEAVALVKEWRKLGGKGPLT